MDPENTPPTEAPTTPESSVEPTQVVNPFESGSTIEPNQESASPQEGAPAETPVAAPETQPASPSVPTSEMIAQTVAQATLEVRKQEELAKQQAQAQQPRQYTAEELNYYSVDEAVFNKIFDSEDPQVVITAMNEMLQGVARQAFTMAQIYTQNQMDSRFQEFQSTVQPYMNFAQQQQEAVMMQQFYTANPTLRGMDTVVNQVLGQLSQGGFKPKSQEELFTEVANRSNALIQQISGQTTPATPGVQGQAQPQQAQPAQQKPTMASVGAGGTGGAGGGQSSSASQISAARQLFG